MRLAAQTGCTLHELGERMSADEFGLWLAFHAAEPTLSESIPLAIAQLRSAIAAGPMTKKGGGLFSAVDFFVDRWELPAAPPAPVSPLAGFKAMAGR